ncbi:MAG: NAD-dependent epimerase/dehydratase family protein [Bryobacteraceae bacterium]
MNSPVLVTGGTGFVGSHLVERLIELGAGVRCLVRRGSSLRYLPVAAVELCYGDLATGAGLKEALEGVETVFHVAGVTKANSSAEYYRGNVSATGNLLRACEESGQPPRRFVQVSSLAAVGPSPDAGLLAEEAEPRPLTHYGKSKLEAERAVRASRLAPNAAIVRPPVVYGPRDTDVYRVFRGISNGLMLRIGRQESLFSFIYVKDLADALVAAAWSPRAPAGTFFVANPEPVSWTEFGAIAASIMGRKVRTVAVPAAVAYAVGWCAEIASRLRRKPGIVSREKVREARCRYWTCDTRKAREELGFSARHSLRDGMSETLLWYKNARWLTF